MRTLIPVTLLFGLALVGASGADDRVEPGILKVSEKYGLLVVVRPEFPVRTVHGAIDGKEGAAKDLNAYLPIFSAEWNLYPAELVKRTKLRRIILCAGLSFAGQLRAAIPDFEHDDLYLDVVRGRYDESYVRKVIHHEYFHVIDYRNGTLYRDQKWSALLPAGAKYAAGGKNAQADSGGSLVRDDLPGFLNSYSMTGVEEDKAEVFANMVVNGSVFEQRVQKDAVLKQKAQRMKAFLADFCPNMDESFWHAAGKLQRASTKARPSS
jgi:hypothetical protein